MIYKPGNKIQLVKNLVATEQVIEEVGQQLRTSRFGTFPNPAIKVLDMWYYADSGYAVDGSVMSYIATDA